jgi:aspartate racemase
MHCVVDVVESATAVPVLHIADVAARAARDAGLGAVGLVGTAYTMEQPFYRERLARHGLEVLVPEAPDRALVHRIIYEELTLGHIRDESRADLARVVGRLAESGAQGVVLACTELELLLPIEGTSVPLFPTTFLHAQAAVELALCDVPE